MSQVHFNEEGQMVNSDTGEIIGSFQNGKINFNSDNAQIKTAQELGIEIPQYPQDIEQYRKNLFEQQERKQIKNQSLSSNNVSIQEIKKNDIANHLQSGKTSFPVQKTKYQVTKDSYFIVKFGLLPQQDGHFSIINDKNVEDFNQAQHHWVKFRMWNYDEQLTWKNQCLQYNKQAGCQLLNYDKLNQLKIKNLMLDWSFGEEYDRLKLLHCDGKLSDQSYIIFKGLMPSIATSIIELMNLVLQNNQ